MRSPGLVLLTAITVACKGGNEETAHTDTTPGTTTTVTSSTTEVTCIAPSADDQTAVQTAFIEVAEGGTVCFEEGTFTFTSELSLNVDGVTIRGAGKDKTILDFSNQNVGGNGILINGDNVTFTQLQVRDTPGDGIRADNVDNISFIEVAAIWTAAASLDNGAYGLYPVGCKGVLIDKCLVVGARDAGIYVGQSERILVRDSEAYGNVAGIEIENSTDAEVVGNHSHDNTAGILVFNLPGLPVQDGKRAKVHDNLVENNNIDNFAAGGTVVAGVPPGVGFFLIAADENEFHDNVITNHKTGGFLLLSWSDLVFGDSGDPSFDPWAERNWIHNNTFSNNGYDPVGQLPDLVTTRPVPDIVFDGCANAHNNMDPAELNCLSDNGSATFYNIDLCNLFIATTEDISTVTCTRDELPTIDPIQ